MEKSRNNKEFYTIADLVRYDLKLPDDHDTTLLALEHMQKTDADFKEKLEKNDLMKGMVIHFLKDRKPLTEDERNNCLIMIALEYMGTMAKQRANFCIIQEERMRKNFDYIAENERESVAFRVNRETQSVLLVLKRYEKVFPEDESYRALVAKLEYYKTHPMHPKTRNVIREE